MTWTTGPLPPDHKTGDRRLGDAPAPEARPIESRPSDTAELPLADLRQDNSGATGHRPALFSERFAERLPSWLGSIRVRLALLYSVMLFVLGAFVVGGIYLAVSHKLDNTEELSRDTRFFGLTNAQGETIIISQNPEDQEIIFNSIKRAVNQSTLDNLRRYSFMALGLLFVGSLGVGWLAAGIVLRPIERITRVAREIQATDLSRRINLRGPNDELRRLADTFDAMLARLDAAFESQRRFIQEASHELRNPLAVIRTNVEVAMSDPDASKEDYAELGAVVGRTAERMSTLVDDLLLYARRGEPANRAGLIDVAPIVVEAAAEFRASAEAKDVRIDYVTTPGLWVHGDPTQFRQALANLLGNAVRHAPAGTAIRVAAGLQDDWVWMAVEDRGPGISPEDQPHVWQRFWRGDKKRAREEGRSGLGLSIVKSIVERHGGRVQLLSELGKGATFILWFPYTAPGWNVPADALPT
jgi:signal transduction histidine kinase